MPWRRLAVISRRCSSRGSPLISTTLSSIRVKTATVSRKPSQSNRAFAVNGSCTKPVRFTDPRRHEP